MSFPKIHKRTGNGLLCGKRSWIEANTSTNNGDVTCVNCRKKLVGVTKVTPSTWKAWLKTKGGNQAKAQAEKRTYHVGVIYTATQWIKVRACSKEEAEQKALEQSGVSLCHYCSREIELEDQTGEVVVYAAGEQ